MFIFKKFHFIYFQNFNYFELRQKYKRYLFIYSISSLFFQQHLLKIYITSGKIIEAAHLGDVHLGFFI